MTDTHAKHYLRTVNFNDVIGHQSVKQRLLQSAKEKRVSHALLFLGPEGSGNLPMSIAFAQYLVCENPGETDSCGVCPGCKKMKKVSHPDVTFTYPVAPKEEIKKPKSIDFFEQWIEEVTANPYLTYNQWMLALDLDNKQGSISTEESGDIISRLSLKSVEAPYKIIIIWLPERMNASSANKLLKIIEEPPEDTLFFLVAEHYESLLPTIISRTQLIKVNKISDEEMIEALQSRHSLDAAAAKRIAHLADGSYSDALMLVNNSDVDKNMNEQFLNWMRSCLKLNVRNISEQSQEFGSETRETQKNFISHALAVVRECMLINYADRSLVRLEGKELEDFTRLAPFINASNAEEFMDELNKAHFHLERNANSKLLFTDLSFSVHRLLNRKVEA
jgi:DNA polymerase-3 subunit delta'